MKKIGTIKTFLSSLALSIFINAVVLTISIKLLNFTFKLQKEPLEVVLLSINEQKVDKKATGTKKNWTFIEKKHSVLPEISKKKVSEHKKEVMQPLKFQNNEAKTRDMSLPSKTTNNESQIVANNIPNKVTNDISNSTQNSHGVQAKSLLQVPSREDYSFLRKLIEKNLTYPYLARRNAYEGTVVVSFIIENGTLRNINIVKSSGYSILDKSAVEAIKKIEPLVRFDRNVKIVIPINFRLSNS